MSGDSPKWLKYTPSDVTLGLDDDKHDEWDCIVIGSGIGGLATASLLAQSGKKVLVLEQHWVPGGCCHSFTSNGYRFGTGIHYVACMGGQRGRQVKNLLDSLTPKDDPVVWDKIDDPFETIILGSPKCKYEKVTDLTAFKAYLIEKFPEDSKQIEKYFQMIKEANSSFRKSFLYKALPVSVVKGLMWTGLQQLIDFGYSKWATKTVEDVLVDLFPTNKDLQAVLAANYIDCGTDPSRAPFITNAVLLTSYGTGSYFPHGGTNNIPSKIIDCIVAHGGKVMTSANVGNIMLADDNKVEGVEMSDGTKIRSKTVVSGTGFVNTALHLLPDGEKVQNVKDLLLSAAKVRDEETKLVGDMKNNKKMDNIHVSPCCFSLFIGIDKDAKELNLPKGGVFFIHPSNDLVRDFNILNQKDLKTLLHEHDEEGKSKPLFSVFVNVASNHDKAWNKSFPGKTTIEIGSFVPWTWFQKYEHPDKGSSLEKEFQDIKFRLASKIWDRVVETFEEMSSPPTALPKQLIDVDHYQIGTPLTYSHFLSRDHGAAYGLDHDLKRFDPEMHYIRLRPKIAEIPGLFMSGQDVSTCGFIGAMMGGLLCSASMLNVSDPFSLLRKDE